MCRKCAEKAKAEILLKVAASGVRPNGRGQTGICVVSHHNHSHYRLRTPDGTPVSGWEQANCQLALLLRVLPRRDWAVHRHSEAEMFAPKPDPGLARRSSAEHPIATKALRCTATA